MKRSVCFCSILLLLLAAAQLIAADGKKDPRAADKQAINKSVQSYLKAFAEGDAKKIAEHWTENGEFFSASGRHIKGSKEIEREFADYFATHPHEKIIVSKKALRFLSPDVVLINGVSRLVPPPKGPPAKCTYTAILIKSDNRWLLDHVRETMTFAPSNYDKLAELSWLVGRWTYDGDSPHIKSVEIFCDWTRNKSYLLRRYIIRLDNDETHTGMQRIGWDPVDKTIRSWMFACDGSADTGVWTKDADRWIIKTQGYLRDGRKTSAVNVLVPIDANAFTFESTQRTANGQPEPNVGPVKIVRKTSRK